MFNTKYPYACTNTLYETDNLKVTTNASGLNLFTLLFAQGNNTNTYAKAGWGTDKHLIYEFKNKSVTPAKLTMLVYDWQTGRSNVHESTLHIDYYIDGVWTEQATYIVPEGSYVTRTLEYELPSMATKQIRIRITQTDGAPSTCIKEMYISFKTESPMIKNKVENTIMQNEFFQSVLPKMEVE